MKVSFDGLAAVRFTPRKLPIRLDIDRYVWDRGLFDLAIPMAMTSLMILSLRFGAA